MLDTATGEEETATELNIDVHYGHSRQHGIQILPGEHNMDGFFYACLQKN
jgi:16S rRNA (cytosine967-C5)-methyltransferase